MCARAGKGRLGVRIGRCELFEEGLTHSRNPLGTDRTRFFAGLGFYAVLLRKGRRRPVMIP
jgi:hypothetical protein